MKVSILITLLFCLFPSAALAEAEIKIVRNVAYLTDGKACHTLDIYRLPGHGQKKKVAPLIVAVHGGAWVYGDKASTAPTFLAKEGYVVASINYRLADAKTSIFPAQIEDCKTAIRWLRKHHDEYGFDPSKIGVWGASAGGHLALLLGMSSERQFKTNAYPDFKSTVEAVCDLSGPTDLFSIESQVPPNNVFAKPSGPLPYLLGATVKNKMALAKTASPIFYVSNRCPPILIMHGALDDIVPLKQSQELYKALKSTGVDVTFKTIPGRKHDVISKQTCELTVLFFDRVFHRLPTK